MDDITTEELRGGAAAVWESWSSGALAAMTSVRERITLPGVSGIVSRLPLEELGEQLQQRLRTAANILPPMLPGLGDGSRRG